MLIIILADEPTGNLDVATSWEIVKILQDINETGTTVIMVTHNTDIVNSLLKRVVSLEKGKIVKDEKKGKLKEEHAPHVSSEHAKEHHAHHAEEKHETKEHEKKEEKGEKDEGN